MSRASIKTSSPLVELLVRLSKEDLIRVAAANDRLREELKKTVAAKKIEGELIAEALKAKAEVTKRGKRGN